MSRESGEDDEEEEEEESEDIQWTKKLEGPRMRMYADEVAQKRPSVFSKLKH